MGRIRLNIFKKKNNSKHSEAIEKVAQSSGDIPWSHPRSGSKGSKQTDLSVDVSIHFRGAGPDDS